MAADSTSENPLDQLRLSLMQDVLPVGLAVLERARQGGPGKVVEVFTAGSEDPIAELRQEGEPVARDVREQLDAVSPGLGNPVMAVSVSVDEPETVDERQDDPDDLMPTLRRIEERLEELRRRLPAEQG
ncbi:hypothetical protein FZZ91_01510 [Synechococcus sp. HB1133]|jgi:hypothetical protein|uniref:hypothetical protein n=1 Tax=unclassified Synechococcus TaxID=2626047 RepID=UPI0014074412|nr:MULTISPECIES: hypothetical protein [unclassified Synechococcus]MCB4421515.1 hypothetical protein [Synechococcus sp. HB1133]MCB4431133.1 hypothetical protein [Synechococcus sp. HBA1120]NHI80458.1 hypothetical protein [Synechococcus sp. HB1133]|tara:strand:+ start:169 stop:555 length:387 start_codon:yes stop_codon:yes gene_type:complete